MARIVAFTDTHGSIEAAGKIVALVEQEDPDLVVSAGDLSLFGSKYEEFMERLCSLGRRVYFVPGNHEPGEDGNKIESGYPFLVNVAFRSVMAEGLQIIGLAGTDDIAPGGPEDEGVHSVAMELWRGLDPSKPVLMITHYAPKGTRCDGLKRNPGDPRPLDLPSGDGGGSRVVRRIIEDLQPSLVVCGHYHISFGEEDRIGRTVILNPGPNGRVFGM